MYRRIVVALDGSELAERVLPHVEALATTFQAAATLVRATTSPASLVMATGADGMPVAPLTPALDPVELAREDAAAASSYLAEIGDRLRAGGVSAEPYVREGAAAEVILERAREIGADLIVMTTHGLGGLGRMLLGSVADEVVRHAPCPVLLVRVHQDS